jgi:hypothetical protein
MYDMAPMSLMGVIHDRGRAMGKDICEPEFLTGVGAMEDPAPPAPQRWLERNSLDPRGIFPRVCLRAYDGPERGRPAFAVPAGRAAMLYPCLCGQFSIRAALADFWLSRRPTGQLGIPPMVLMDRHIVTGYEWLRFQWYEGRCPKCGLYYWF